MMQDADGKGVIENSWERQVVDVGLDHMGIRYLAGGRKSGFDGLAEIDSDYLARPPTRSQLRMATFTATTFEHHFVNEKVWAHGRYPAQKLFRVSFVGLCEMGPLPPKARGSCGFVGCDFFEAREPWNAASNRKAIREQLMLCAADQLALHYLRALALRGLEIESLAAGGASQILQQAVFHVVSQALQQKCYYCTSFRY